MIIISNQKTAWCLLEFTIFAQWIVNDHQYIFRINTNFITVLL